MKLTDGTVATWSKGAAVMDTASGAPTVEYSPDQGTTWFPVKVTAEDLALIPDGVQIRASGGDAWLTPFTAATGPN